MDMNAIINQIQTDLEAELRAQGYDVAVESMEVAKNNSTMLQGLKISKTDSCVAPTLYIDKALEDIQNGQTSIDEVVSKLSAVYINSPMEEVERTAKELDFENGQSHLYCQVVNLEANRELLKDTPYKKIEDLAVIARYRVSDDASFIVHNAIAEQMGMDSSEVIEYAIKNSVEDGFTIRSMGEVLMGMMAGSDSDMEEAGLSIASDCGMYVISNSQSCLGAAGPYVDRELRSQIRQAVGGDYYILPSSTHEVLAIKDDGSTDYKNLEAMVREVNATQVSPEERLSDHIYHVDQSLKLSMCKPEVQSQHAKEPAQTQSQGMHM